MAAKKRGDNKLRLITGGAAPKVVVTGRREPSREPRAESTRPTPPRAIGEVRSPALDEPIVAANDHSVSPDARVAPGSSSRSIPRAAIFAALVVVVGAAAYALSRNSANKPAPAPTLTAAPPADWASQKMAPMPSASASP